MADINEQYSKNLNKYLNKRLEQYRKSKEENKEFIFHDEFEMATILFAYAAENLNKKLGIKNDDIWIYESISVAIFFYLVIDFFVS